MHANDNPVDASAKIIKEFEAELAKIEKKTNEFLLQQAALAIKAWEKAIRRLHEINKSPTAPAPERHLQLAYNNNISATIIAGERFVDRLYKAMLALKNNGYDDKTKLSLVWTAKKVELIELGYALKAAGVINGGMAELNQIMTTLEKSFHLDLDNYARTFQEIIYRKSGSSKFMDKLKYDLLAQIDELLK